MPLFVSHRRLQRQKTWRRAVTTWALDSGGFTELRMHGRWVTTEDEYVDAVGRYQAEIGGLVWAAPMDWMCDPELVTKTGLSVREHQQRTVENYLRLRDHGPFAPVLQGWHVADYVACAELYADHGVDLTTMPVVGVGSVVSRQTDPTTGAIFRELVGAGIRCHGFGVKTTGLRNFGHYLTSADSLAWSYNARRHAPLPGCKHKSCSNCIKWALRWRAHLLADGVQMELA